MKQFGLSRIVSLCLIFLLAAGTEAGANAARSLRHAKKATKALRQNKAVLQPANTLRQTKAAAQITRAASKHLKLPWQPDTKIKLLLSEQPDPVRALSQVQQWQDIYGNHNLFNTLAMRVYVNNFGLVTPHLNKLFKKITSLNHRPTENRFMAQMRFLMENKSRILPEISAQKIPKENIRLRYTADVDKITAQNFNAQKLVLSVEQHMSPNPEKDFPIRHINGGSTFTVPSGTYAVYQYAGPMELIPSLYRFLLNGTRRRAPITLVFDEESKSLVMYNENKTLWLRITPHEYENPKKLHIHLNEQRLVSFTDEAGKTQTVTVNANLSIPLLPPDNLPAHKEAAFQFLYEKLVLSPVKNLQSSQHVTIERRSIF